jgi:hypothetical protein
MAKNHILAMVQFNLVIDAMMLSIMCRQRLDVLLVILTLLSLAPALKIASALNTIEYTPEAIAKDYYKGNGTITITNGGVANIVGDTSIDLAGNAETQVMTISFDFPN